MHGVGEKLFKEDYGRRMKMFKALMENVALYGADRIKRRKYVKWILGLDKRTLNYVLAEQEWRN